MYYNSNFGGQVQQPMPQQMPMYGQGPYPVMDNRLSALEMQMKQGQQNPNLYGGRQQPQQMQVPTQQQFIKAIPVTSFDEAKAAMIDFDGSLFIFANIQNGEIYTKQLNINTGSCDLKVYSLLNNLGNQGAAPQVANVQEPEPQIEYATKVEVLQLQEQISKLEGVVNNAVDKSNAVATTSRTTKSK